MKVKLSLDVSVFSDSHTPEWTRSEEIDLRSQQVAFRFFPQLIQFWTFPFLILLFKIITKVIEVQSYFILF